MSVSFTPAERARLEPFVTSCDRSVYCLRNLPEEVVAVLFAYYSRSRETLRENLLRLLAEGDLDLAAEVAGRAEAAGGPGAPAGAGSPGGVDAASALTGARKKARAFHEKWVVGFGHSSVAEHAVVHVAVEGVSILAGKVIEDARLASFTEKSTRYVAFDTRFYHTPAAVAASPHAAAFEAGIRALTTTYDRLMEPLVGHILATRPAGPDRSEKAHQAACRAQACDVLRYLLPAAVHTNVGMTVSARSLEGLLVKMLSHPLEEVRSLAALIKEEALKIVPTLVRYAGRSDYRATIDRRMSEYALRLPWGEREPEPPAGSGVRLVRFDPDAEERVIEGLLFGASGRSAAGISRVVEALSPAERGALLEECFARRGLHDPPPRALEQTDYTFEIVTDFGAYRDIQRHRMAVQFPQRLSLDLGYERPPEIDGAGMTTEFDRAVEEARRAWDQIAPDLPEEAQYVVPLACRRRVFFRMNLRELHHFIQLRSARQGHASYRRIAREMHQEVARVHPRLASYIRVDMSDHDLSRG